MRNIGTIELVRSGRLVALGALMGASAASLLAGGGSTDARLDAPASLERIQRTVDGLAPACRMIARKGLMQTLDHGRRAWISERDLETVTAPLARGGSGTCDAIGEQRFGLGEV